MKKITKKMWDEAIRQLDSVMYYYEDYMRFFGDNRSFEIVSVASSLKARYISGERTKSLYDAILLL